MFDKEGFLCDLNDWNASVARDIAASKGITLSDTHWQLIELVRSYHADYGLFPVNRVLVKKMQRILGDDKGSIFLMQLFGEKPARHLAMIAGLPKPVNCD